jgi:arsenate reductase (thioredoxin)
VNARAPERPHSGNGSAAGPPRILFVCTGNACRSQMAVSYARRLRPECLLAESAGTNPHGERWLDPIAVRVMDEIGIDIHANPVRRVHDLDLGRFDYVVTLCPYAHSICPPLPAGTVLLHVPFDDPPILACRARTEDGVLAVYRRVRAEIRAFVEGLPATLPDLPARSCP